MEEPPCSAPQLPYPSHDSRLQQLLAMVSDEFVGQEQDAPSLDFAEIERRAHEAGRELARRLCERVASQVVRTGSTSLTREGLSSVTASPP